MAPGKQACYDSSKGAVGKSLLHRPRAAAPQQPLAAANPLLLCADLPSLQPRHSQPQGAQSPRLFGWVGFALNTL